MKSLLSILVAATFGLAVQTVLAADASALAQKGGCMACHGIDKKILGPAFKDVATKYKGKGAEAALVKKVKEGGSGVWGPMPMPSNAGKLSDDEFKAVVDWIVSL
jgi:cytochrome c